MTFSITGASFKSTFMFARRWYTGHNASLAAWSPTRYRDACWHYFLLNFPRNIQAAILGRLVSA